MYRCSVLFSLLLCQRDAHQPKPKRAFVSATPNRFMPYPNTRVASVSGTCLQLSQLSSVYIEDPSVHWESPAPQMLPGLGWHLHCPGCCCSVGRFLWKGLQEQLGGGAAHSSLCVRLLAWKGIDTSFSSGYLLFVYTRWLFLFWQ